MEGSLQHKPNAAAAIDDLAALERFVVENDELLALEERIGRFNIFDALGVARAEIRHSNFLAWLLDPQGSHRLGSRPLAAILERLGTRASTSVLEQIARIDKRVLQEASICREDDWIDLSIEFKSPPTLLVIENKIEAGEHGDQLKRYEQSVSTRFPSHARHFFFLTPDARQASRSTWASIGYLDIHDAIRGLMAASDVVIAPEVRIVLGHYLELLRSICMQDEEVVKLCEGIIRKHRRAVQLLAAHIEAPQSKLLEIVADRLQSRSEEWLVTHRRKTFIGLSPTGWPDALPEICTDKNNASWQWITLRVTLYENAVYAEAYIGPTSDVLLRNRVLKALVAQVDFGFRNRRGRWEDNDWRVLWSARCAQWKDASLDPEDAAARTVCAMEELRLRLARLPAVVQAAVGTNP